MNGKSEFVRANVIERKETIPDRTPEKEPECIHVVYDKDRTAYCHANIKQKSFSCTHADYNAHSYFPLCRKYTKV